jgi:ATP-dependent helicase HrpB
MIALPIDSLIPEVLAGLQSREALVLEAPPGAGKTTRVPSALLDADLALGKEIVVLQPRRLATRLAATRVAEERGERLGETVGYNIRFEDVSSKRTRLRFVTEGILTRRLVSDPQLSSVGVVVLDEFHERHLAGDLALAMLRRLQLSTRPDLKLVVMSATLDAAPIASWLANAPILRSEGRRFDVRIDYLEREDDRRIEEQVLAALKRLLQANLDGHVLVFLPGAFEIQRAQEACAELAQRHDLELHVLHGDLSAADQDRALRPSARRKVILTTNVAETSVTVDGVAAVVDAGLARVAGHSPWSGLPALKLAKISKASAVQRAGRAGRTRAGVCLRLYTRADFDLRPPVDAPEIRRLDFTESALALRAFGHIDVAAFPFFESPSPAAIGAAESLLHRLGAITREGELTAIGKRLLALPLHPRLARVIVEGERRGAARECATLAALLTERDIRLDSRARLDGGRRGGAVHSGDSDLLERWDLYRRNQSSAAGLDRRAVGTVSRVEQQLARLIEPNRAPSPRTEAELEDALLRAIVSGFPDRVARRRRPKAPECVLSGGGSATLDAASVVHDAEFFVAVDAEERKSGIVVRLASRIEPEWLLEISPDDLGETDELQWSSAAQRVERVTRMTYGQLVVEETRAPAPASDATTRVLIEASRSAELRRFVDPEALAAWRCRVETVRQGFPKAQLPDLDDLHIRGVLESVCEGRRSFAELEESNLLEALKTRLTPQQNQLLTTQAPERLQLPGGRSVTVNYDPGKPPWIESRLQDFFGLVKGPCIGQLPLVLHLLAPNMRAVQVTTDLAGFWDRHYPAVRRELMRRYPRHSWPEDPRTAQPPPPRRPR